MSEEEHTIELQGESARNLSRALSVKEDTRWPQVPTALIFKKIGSGTTPKGDHSYTERPHGFPWVTTSELRENLITETAKNVTADAMANNPSLVIHPKGSVVIAMYGATIGRLGVLGVDASTNQACCVFSEPVNADPRFFYFALLSERTALIEEAVGGGQPNISQNMLRRWRVPSPPLETQRRIADYLDHETGQIDAMIDKLGELKAKLRTRRQTLISTSVMQNSKERPFLTCISRIVDYRGRTPKKTDAGIQLVTARNIRPGWIDYETSKEYVDPAQYESIMSRGLPEDGDLLFTMEAPLGYVALVDRTDIALAQRIVKWTVDESVVTPKFLMYAVLGDVLQSELMIRATGSTALGIKASKFSELRIALPPLEEQHRIADHLDDVTSKIDTMLAKVAQLKALLTERRAALITDVVTGRKDVA